LGSACENCGKLKPVAPPNLHERSDYGSSSFFFFCGTGSTKKRFSLAVSALWFFLHPCHPPPPAAAKTVYICSSPFGVAIASASPRQLSRHLQTVKPETLELSASPPRPCSTFWRSHSETGAQARAGDWRS